MPIDPNIAMGFQNAEMPNVLGMMAQRQQMLNQKSQNALMQQQFTAQQTEMARQNALRQSLTGLDPTTQEGRTSIQQAYLHAGDAKGALEFASNAAKFDKDSRDSALAKIKLDQEHLGAISQAAAGLFSKPDLSFSDVQAAEQDLVKKGHLTPEESSTQLAQWQADPAFAANPTQFLRAKLGQMAQQGMSAHDQLEAQKPQFVAAHGGDYGETISVAPGAPFSGTAPTASVVPGSRYSINVSPNASLRLSYGVTPEENDALSRAMAEGRLNPDKVNSRNASILAHAELSHPGIDLNGLAANGAMLRNVGYQQKAQSAEIIPQLIQNVVESGKKLGFSDVKVVGRMQAFLKGELNDPQMQDYMAQRNDNLMMIAQAARGIGMSDFATKMEQEVSSPTMSPAALDAWGKAQMKSLLPRIEMYRKHNTDMRPDAAGTPPASGPLPGQKPKADASAGPVRITSDADFEKLPSGTEFIAPDGSHRKKP